MNNTAIENTASSMFMPPVTDVFAPPAINMFRLPVKDGIVTKQHILNFEKAISKLPGAVFGDNDLCPVKHSFCDGLYMREIFFPAGALVTGKIHNEDNFSFLMSGEMTMATEEGGIQELKAPMAMTSLAGIKRAAYAKTDCVFITIHKNPENNTDTKQLLKKITSDTFEQFESQKKLLKGKVKNCGLTALDNLCVVRKMSAASLVALAKDNGVSLTCYKVPVSEINALTQEAIFHSENHFVFVGKDEKKPDLKYSGYVFSAGKIDYPVITESLDEITGESALAVAGIVAAGAGIYVALTNQKTSAGANAAMGKASGDQLAAAKAMAEAEKVKAQLALEQAKVMAGAQEKADAAKTKRVYIYGGIGIVGVLLLVTMIAVIKD
jgi:hypothetical protein